MNRKSWLLSLAITLALTGCPDRAVLGFPDGATGLVDVGADVGAHDAGPDATHDAAIGLFDSGMNVDFDGGVDASIVASIDASIDAAVGDGGPDASLDAANDGGSAIDALLDAHADAPMILDARRDDAGHRGPAPVFLGIAGDLTQCGAYALIGKTGITNVIGSLITGGHLGVSPGAATLLTGFGLVMDPSLEFSTSPSVMSPFRVYAADYAVPTPTNLTSAVASMQTAYTDAAGRSLPDFLNLLSGNIGGLTLAPGLYTWGSTVTIPSDITISGGSNDVWIFQVTGDLDLSAATHMLLAGGADARNIFWQVSGNVIVHANAHFEGNILCQTGITMQTSASLHGRALSQSLVALDNNAITAP